MNPGTQDLHCLEYGVILDMTRVQMQGIVSCVVRSSCVGTEEFLHWSQTCTAHVTKMSA